MVHGNDVVCQHNVWDCWNIVKSALKMHDLSNHSKIEFRESPGAVSAQLAKQLGQLEIAFSVERRCAACCEPDALGPLELSEGMTLTTIEN